jgi:hypothetical protein
VPQGKLPALGWNTWNAFGCNINETNILTAANQIVKLGLKDAGYEYVNSKLFIPISSIYVLVLISSQLMIAGPSNLAAIMLLVKSSPIPRNSRQE